LQTGIAYFEQAIHVDPTPVQDVALPTGPG
jgi:hypothetical protein